MSRNIIAILRGLEPSQAHDMGATLIEAGIDHIEVPLNSPRPRCTASELLRGTLATTR